MWRSKFSKITRDFIDFKNLSNGRLLIPSDFNITLALQYKSPLT